jgi:hypothetical protein
MKYNRTSDAEYVICEICKEKRKRIESMHLKTHNITYKQYIELYPEAKTITLSVVKSTSITKENLVKKYGHDEGLIRWEKYKQKQADSNTFEYKKLKYNWSEKEFENYNKSRAVTKNNLINKHGLNEGIKMWDSYVTRQKYAGCEKEYFIEKYGEIEGNIKYKELNNKKKNNLENYIRKYGEVEGIKKFDNYIKKISKKPFYSKISQILFEQIAENDNSKIYYATNKNGEFCIYDESIKKVRFYDYVDNFRKKCIEFNGNVYHANPEIYTENDNPNFRNKKLKSIDIWNEDSIKNELIKSKGYDLLVVWEKDFTENPQKVIEICLEFLYGKKQL